MRRDGYFAQWQPTLQAKRGSADHDRLQSQEHELVWVLKQDEGILTRELMAVSDPSSPRYGQHLDFDAAGQLTANPEGTIAVTTLLTKHGCRIVGQTPHGHFIRARATISTWNELLDADFQPFEFIDSATDATAGPTKANAPSRKVLIRSPQLTIPHDLGDIVHFVAYGTSLPPPSRTSMRSTGSQKPFAQHPPVGGRVRRALDAQNGIIWSTPAALHEWYETTDVIGSTSATGAVVEFDNYYSPIDLMLFQYYFDVPMAPITDYTGTALNKEGACYESLNDCQEASLDIQYLSAMAPGSNLGSVSYEDSSMVAFAYDMSTITDPPQVLSISYGGPEALTDPGEMDVFNWMAQNLGIRGVTILAAAGDNGANLCPRFVDDAHPDPCVFAPHFPASCPYVLSVGATNVLSTDGSQQEACMTGASGITTGGGFSNHFAMPSFQKQVVDEYLDEKAAHLPPTSMFNRSNRAYPDLAASGSFFPVYANNTRIPLAGTSASTPVVASLIMLVNARRLEAGLPSLGYFLPTLYSNGAGTTIANDVVTGSNQFCESPAPSCPIGFNASEGWDPLTGFGTVTYPSLLALLGPQTTTTTAANPTTTFPVAGVTETAWIVATSVLLVIVLGLLAALVVVVARAKKRTSGSESASLSLTAHRHDND